MIFTLGFSSTNAQVIDMHMHSYTEKDFWVGKARNGFESSTNARETQMWLHPMTMNRPFRK